jgi:outer membrane protein insertion porin family
MVDSTGHRADGSHGSDTVRKKGFCSGIFCAGRKPLLLIILTGILAAGCSNLRYLEDHQSLYTGSRVKLESGEPIENERKIIREAEGVIRPEPNWRFLIWRPRLWLYNIGGEISLWNIGDWLQNKTGRPPVLIEDFNTQKIAELIENRIFNMGHFDASVDYSLKERRKKTEVDFNVRLKPAYRIRNIILLKENIPVAKEINRSMEESILHSGDVFRLDELKKERERIDRYLKEKGYYYFYPDYILFRADSTAGTREVDLHLSILQDAPPGALVSYKIRNIIIETGRTGQREKETGAAEKVQISDGIFTRPGRDILNPQTMLRAIFLEKDHLYNYEDHSLTISHLMSMRVFRFVNVRFDRVQHEADNKPGNNYLDARIILTPREKMALSAELKGVSKSNNFAGPGFTTSFSNRNLRGGAENLTIRLDGAFETLTSLRGVSMYEAGILSELSIHRLVIPFDIIRMRPRFTPQTRMSLSYNYLNRTDAFSLSTIRSEFGYVMNPYISTQLRLTPFVFNAFFLGTIAEEFGEEFPRELLIRRGLFEQFLLGSEYSYTYNSKLTENGNQDWYINLKLDLAGNTPWLLLHNLGLGSVDDKGEYTIFNQGFSQFTKILTEIRYSFETGNSSNIATRLIAGIGVPYGNSEFLPYTKQLIIGGSHSIRAFHPRTLGPGTFSPVDSDGAILNIYHGGEIKLEMNLEYRFDISSIFKGAVFADAGNIWNLREQEEVPGGKFRSRDFMKQVALGTGIGLRLDFNFFLLRLDLSFPLADPRTLNETGRYFGPVRPLDSSWRRENLILNLAIGYPF